MPRRPTYQHGIKRVKICDWPQGVDAPEEVAARVTYTGNPKHKTYPSPASPPAQRSDAAKCDQYAPENWPRLLCRSSSQAFAQDLSAGFEGDFLFVHGFGSTAYCTRLGLPTRPQAIITGFLSMTLVNTLNLSTG